MAPGSPCRFSIGTDGWATVRPSSARRVRLARGRSKVHAVARPNGIAARGLCDRLGQAGRRIAGVRAAGRPRTAAAQMGAGLHAVAPHVGRAGRSAGRRPHVPREEAAVRRAHLSRHRLLPGRLEHRPRQRGLQSGDVRQAGRDDRRAARRAIFTSCSTRTPRRGADRRRRSNMSTPTNWTTKAPAQPPQQRHFAVLGPAPRRRLRWASTAGGRTMATSCAASRGSPATACTTRDRCWIGRTCGRGVCIAPATPACSATAAGFGRATSTAAGQTLATQVPIGQNHSLSLSPYWGTDIGGFYPTRELTGELYVRWFQFGTFCPSFRAHGRTWHLRLPWGWNTGELGPDEHNRSVDLNELHNPERRADLPQVSGAALSACCRTPTRFAARRTTRACR